MLVLSANSGVGTLLWRNWPVAGDLVGQSRSDTAGFLSFDPLAEPKTLKQAIDGTRAVLCLSGVTPAYASRTGADLGLNAVLARAVVQAAVGTGSQVFLASSAAVYGAAAGLLNEGQDCTPVSDYGRAKLDMEHSALALAERLGVEATVLRLGNIAGADALLSRWKPGAWVHSFADGTTPRRSYIGPISLARVLHDLSVQTSLPKVVNVAAPGMVAMGDLFDAAGLAWRNEPAPAGVIKDVALDVTQLSRLVDLPAELGHPDVIVDEWIRGGR